MSSNGFYENQYANQREIARQMEIAAEEARSAAARQRYEQQAAELRRQIAASAANNSMCPGLTSGICPVCGMNRG